MKSDLQYKIALALLPGIGGVLARNLVAYVGSVEEIFTSSSKALCKIPGIGENTVRRIKNSEVMSLAEREIEFIQKNNIGAAFYTDENYPRRLKNCIDSPILVFTKGSMNLNEERVVSIVGTRNATEYGRKVIDDLVAAFALRNYRILIVSGLAYGIDVHAHRAALKNGIQTVGVVAHGLDRLYPSLHRETAKAMVENGGLVSDFPSGTKIDPQNFLKRNRIIAGLADATIVVESAEKGGALVTADIAASYNRDVFAFPGRAGDTYSRGCNQLIRRNGAALIENIDDLEYLMGWEPAPKKKEVQTTLFVELKPEEQKVVDMLRGGNELFIDQIAAEFDLPVSRVSAMMLGLEFKNVIQALPGKMYRLR